METLKSASDWLWYKRRLDAEEKHEHGHGSNPERYPCKVESQFESHDNGPDSFTHRFFYQEEKTCENCGHKSLEWQVS